MINWQLVKHPANWVIIFLMLAIAGAFGHFVLAHFGAEPASGDDAVTQGNTRTEMTRAEYAASVLQ